MIGNNIIDVDAELDRLPPGIKDRRAWRLNDRNLGVTEEAIAAWLKSHGINVKIVFDPRYGIVRGIGIVIGEDQ